MVGLYFLFLSGQIHVSTIAKLNIYLFSLIIGPACIHTSNITCHQLHRRESWSRVAVTGAGFYVNRTWHNTKCRPTVTTKSDILQCLKGRPLLAYGDSNSRSFINYLVKLLNLTKITKQKSQKYTDYFLANDTYNDISVSWQSHGLPWLVWEESDNKNFIPTAVNINLIPEKNNSIILIHVWAHRAHGRIAEFRNEVKHIHGEVVNLLQRSPGVDVFIKGSHSVTYQPSMPFDYLHLVFYGLWKSIFRDIQDRVIYLDFWDLTVGNRNVLVHPEIHTVKDMVNVMLSHVCK